MLLNLDAKFMTKCRAKMGFCPFRVKMAFCSFRAKDIAKCPYFETI